MQGLYTDDGVFVAIPRRDRNSTPWSIRTFSSTWKGNVLGTTLEKSRHLREQSKASSYEGVIQEWVDEGEWSRDRTKNQRWRMPYDVLAEATYGEVVVRGARQVQGQGRVSERCYQGSYGEQNRRKPCNKMAKAIHESCSLSFHRPGRTAIVSKQVVERGEEATTSPVGLNYPKVKRRLERRWTQRSTTVQ
ncbi:hypothetical protein GW17_00025277 [Ensete ventricosum]|nr:hypothetical protein GW17_00025277 [Ensete ventricosum]RZS18383.1 hypothetical protein BHM03_00050660 [Ensete ventricosum]